MTENLDDPNLLPMGSILPFLEDEEEIPEGFEVIDGQTITLEDNPDFVDHIYRKLTYRFDDPTLRELQQIAARLLTSNGGWVGAKYIRLPTFSPEEAATHAYGPTALPKNMPNLKLIIKTQRTLKSDGAS